jgi:hypothetical protein
MLALWKLGQNRELFGALTRSFVGFLIGALS